MIAADRDTPFLQCTNTRLNDDEDEKDADNEDDDDDEDERAFSINSKHCGSFGSKSSLSKSNSGA